MPKIEHSSMKSKQYNGSENYVVEDATQTDLDDHIAQFEGRVSQVNAKEDKKPTTNKTLENLIFMGKHSKIVEFAGNKFEVSTLTNKEHTQIIRQITKISDMSDLFAIRVCTLANALKSINDVSLDEIGVDGVFEDSFQKRISVIDNLQVSLVERLFNSYEELVNESNHVVYGEEVKK